MQTQSRFPACLNRLSQRNRHLTDTDARPNDRPAPEAVLEVRSAFDRLPEFGA